MEKIKIEKQKTDMLRSVGKQFYWRSCQCQSLLSCLKFLLYANMLYIYFFYSISGK